MGMIKERPTITSVTVTGAYGRDYTSRDAAIADWHAGKDFEIRALFPKQATGLYISIRDLQASPNAEVRIRYQKKANLVTLTYPVNVGSAYMRGRDG